METRSEVRQSDEIRRMFKARNDEEETQNDDSSDSELDQVEELEGSEDDCFDDTQNSTSEEADSDDDQVAQEAKRAKRRRTSQSAASDDRSRFLYGKNGYEWSLDPPEPNADTTKSHQGTYGPCGVGAAASVTSEGAAWSLLLPDETLEKIVSHTNQAIAKKRRKFSTNPTFTNNLDLCELRAFIGLLYFSGLQGSTRRNLKNLYGILSSPIFRATMSRSRFEFLLSVLRFDEKSTRHERRSDDKMAAIRDVWDAFVRNSKSNFNAGKNVTIDEQMLNFHGKCAFRVCVKNNSQKSGLKMFTMNDAETSYLIDAIPYIGQVVPNKMADCCVRKLTESIVGSERNITCDNWFTSIGLVEKLKRENSLTMVGKICKDKPEIPEAMKIVSEIRGSKFVYANGMTLVSHCPKKNKVVILLSSLHEIGQIGSNGDKPEIIRHYNRTKEASKTFDDMCREYSVARGTRRWPLRFFYGILDQSSINAFVLFSLNRYNNLIDRREFNDNLAYHLVTPFLQRRLGISTLRLNVRALIEMVLGIEFTTKQLPDVIDCTLDKQVRCAFCHRNKDKKTKYVCSKCRLPRCQDHRSMQCTLCAPD